MPWAFSRSSSSPPFPASALDTRLHALVAPSALTAPKDAAAASIERRLKPLPALPVSFLCGGAMGARLPNSTEDMRAESSRSRGRAKGSRCVTIAG
ncbi:hypothetical protein GCM10009863_31740 [Streptomyces axinellae]|uniref:Uncharacterized protein n=1 Tax=Streptomyces axinellae TaxID=552788 RepID=A0ABN3Q4E8_9ACTN